MTPTELVDGLTEIASEDRIILSTFLLYLAKRAPEARLANGERLNDVSACSEWLMELARELRVNHG